MSISVILDAKLDLPAASGMASKFRENIDQDITVDFSQVKHLGALCLQVLLSAAKTQNSRGRSIQLVNISDRVMDQMRVLGVTPDIITRGSQ